MPNVFRWNIARREQLGRLVTGESVEGLPWILEEVRRCAARVMAMAGDSQLVFVGRSPEALFDYLTGALAGTSWSDRTTLLHLSLKGSSDRWAEMTAETRSELRAADRPKRVERLFSSKQRVRLWRHVRR